jgi:hypothetical protein
MTAWSDFGQGHVDLQMRDKVDAERGVEWEAFMSWELKGVYFESCNCDVACPCVFLSKPTMENCTLLVGWHIDDGHDGDVRLDGLNVALAVHSPGHMLEAPWRAAAYVDDRADEAQRVALLRIFGGQAGGHPARMAAHVGELLGATPVPITFEHTESTYRLAIPGIAEAAIEAMSGQSDGPIDRGSSVLHSARLSGTRRQIDVGSIHGSWNELGAERKERVAACAALSVVSDRRWGRARQPESRCPGRASCGGPSARRPGRPG